MSRPLSRLAATTRTLGLETAKTGYSLRPAALAQDRAAPGLATVGADVLQMLLEHLDRDADKVALVSASRGLLIEQRRLRPAISYRPRTSLDVLTGAFAAGWRVARCHVDKKAGLWTPTSADGRRDDAYHRLLADLESFAIVGRPDCALLVLSPFTGLHCLTRLHCFEVNQCAIGDAGVAVLAAAFRRGVMANLQILDLRRNRTRAPPRTPLHRSVPSRVAPKEVSDPCACVCVCRCGATPAQR